MQFCLFKYLHILISLISVGSIFDIYDSLQLIVIIYFRKMNGYNKIWWIKKRYIIFDVNVMTSTNSVCECWEVDEHTNACEYWDGEDELYEDKQLFHVKVRRHLVSVDDF